MNKSILNVVSRARFGFSAILSVVMLLGTVSATSAIDLSVGANLFYTPPGTFGGIKGSTEESGIKMKMENVWEIVGGGVELFVDVGGYAEVNLGIASGERNNIGAFVEVNGAKQNGVTNYANETTTMNIGVLGKYPVSLLEKLTVYPAAGIEYLICMGGMVDSTTYLNGGFGNERDWTDADEFNNLWIKLGAGADYQFGSKMFARAQILYGIGFPPEQVVGDEQPDWIKKVYGSSFTFKVGVGYKL